jgi:hypothetical protein
MTPQDVPGEIVSIETLFPWLSAIVPAQEPVRSLRSEPEDADREREPAQLRDAA